MYAPLRTSEDESKPPSEVEVILKDKNYETTLLHTVRENDTQVHVCLS